MGCSPRRSPWFCGRGTLKAVSVRFPEFPDKPYCPSRFSLFLFVPHFAASSAFDGLHSLLRRNTPRGFGCAAVTCRHSIRFSDLLK